MIRLDIWRSELESAVVDAKRRAMSYHEMDGLSTMVGVAGWLVLGCFCTLWLTRRGVTWNTWRFGGLMVIVSSLWSPLASWLIRCLRSRITYPRTGYVSLPKPTFAELQKQAEEDREHHPETLVWFMWIGFAVSYLSLGPHPWFDLGILTVGLLVLWFKTRWRFPFAGLMVPGLWLSGLLMAFLRVPSNYRVSYMLAAVAVLYLIKGATELVRYLRQHPAPQAASIESAHD
jgi:hypothetical protein